MTGIQLHDRIRKVHIAIGVVHKVARVDRNSLFLQLFAELDINIFGIGPEFRRPKGHEGLVIDNLETVNQIGNFGTYLSATKLFLDCLELASVSDKQAIKDSLLLPPKS